MNSYSNIRNKNEKSSHGIYSFILTTFLALFSLVYSFPFFLLFINSFKPEKDILNIKAKVNFTNLENFSIVFRQKGFISSIFLTVAICIITISLAIIFSSMSGYIVSRARKGFIKNMYWIFVVTMIVPYQSGMVVLYNLGVRLHMINTVPYLILIYLGGNVSYSSLIYFAFTKSIPREMEESAIIDGCGKFKAFYKIIFPLLLPATGTIIATEVFWYWNDMQGPLIYLGAGIGRVPKTLMLFINNFKVNLGSYSYQMYAPISALCLVSCIPMIIFFLCTQKYLLRGLVVGAIKG
jgi:raffinose/stachyose/melibiose transport system permease protein